MSAVIDRLTSAAVESLSTGYYGRYDAQDRQRVSKIHFKLRGEHRPLCGAAIHTDMAWHWCAGRAEREWVECTSCERALDRIQPST